MEHASLRHDLRRRRAGSGGSSAAVAVSAHQRRSVDPAERVKGRSHTLPGSSAHFMCRELRLARPGGRFVAQQRRDMRRLAHAKKLGAVDGRSAMSCHPPSCAAAASTVRAAARVAARSRPRAGRPRHPPARATSSSRERGRQPTLTLSSMPSSPAASGRRERRLSASIRARGSAEPMTASHRPEGRNGQRCVLQADSASRMGSQSGPGARLRARSCTWRRRCQMHAWGHQHREACVRGGGGRGLPCG